MKQIKHLLITIAVLLCSVAANAYDFEVDGIYYNIISFSDLTLEVTYGDNSYTGTVVIPSTVSYKSKTLSVTSIGSYAFRYCTNLTSVTIPSSVISIGNYAFDNCSLENLRIEDGTEILSLGYNYYNYSTSNGIGQGLFYKCKLKALYLGRNISYSASRAKGFSPFYNSTLTSVTIGNSVTSIGNCAFYNCSSLTSVTIPNSVTSIGNSAFDYCSGLTSIEIGNSVTSIGNYAFYKCSILTSVTIPNSVTTIGYSAFENCSSLTNVTIGKGLAIIESEAFKGCPNFVSIYLEGTIPPIVYDDNFTKSHYMDATVYVPIGSLSTYQTADTWKNFWDIQELDATGIEDVNANDIAIKVTANGIALFDADGKTVAIYSANGTRVANIDSYVGEEITLDRGVYIVRVGSNTLKVKL